MAAARYVTKLLSATVADCRSDYRTPAERDAAAVKAREQRGQAQVDGNAAAGFWHGRKNP